MRNDTALTSSMLEIKENKKVNCMYSVWSKLSQILWKKLQIMTSNQFTNYTTIVNTYTD